MPRRVHPQSHNDDDNVDDEDVSDDEFVGLGGGDDNEFEEQEETSARYNRSGPSLDSFQGSSHRHLLAGVDLHMAEATDVEIDSEGRLVDPSSRKVLHSDS